MELLNEDDIANLREAITIVQTSVHLLRKHVGHDKKLAPYAEKHFSRIEENLRRAVVALLPG